MDYVRLTLFGFRFEHIQHPDTATNIMAIIPTLPGIEVVVETPDGQAYAEYDDDEEEGANDADTHPETKVIRKYIESETGARFCLSYKRDPEYDPECTTLGFDLKVDGTEMDGCLMDCSDVEDETVIHDGVMVGSDTFRPFSFAKINTCKLCVSKRRTCCQI